MAFQCFKLGQIQVSKHCVASAETIKREQKYVLKLAYLLIETKSNLIYLLNMKKIMAILTIQQKIISQTTI